MAKNQEEEEKQVKGLNKSNKDLNELASGVSVDSVDEDQILDDEVHEITLEVTNDPKEIWEPYLLETKGTTHLRNGIEIQDSASYYKCDDYLILAVADGHGGKDYQLSSIGASLAVDAFIFVSRHFLEQELSEEDTGNSIISSLKNPNHFGKSILNKWKELIKKRYNSINNLLNVNLSDDKSIFKLFGSTLLGAITFTGKFSFYFKIGDGNIVVKNNDEFQKVFPEKLDSGLLGTETFSLSSSRALNNINISLVPSTPDGIMIFSDGLDDSAVDESSLQEILDFFYTNVDKSTPSFLKTCLEKISEQGVGDDITLLIGKKEK